MGILATARINTTQRSIVYRGFIIEESTEGWEWTHEDFARGVPVTGTCQTLFECIEAVADWHERQDAQPHMIGGFDE